jgi:pilus assembly protein FimV
VRNVTKALTVVSLLAPVSGFSLGIGDIRVRSALNQNLNAEIALVGAPGENPTNIKVSLASPEKFDEAGVAWSYFLSKIKFQPIVKPNGAMVIKVTSREALKEPYLNFLLEVSWPKGNLYREFTVLVDPPTDYQEPAYPVSSTYESRASQQAEPYEPRPRQSATRQIPARSQRSSYNGSYGGQIVSRRNDTLWKLAARTRGSGVSVEQMMMSLYEKNPHAFFQQNVNALSAGETLKIPEKSVVQQLSKQEALAEFSQHNKAWKNGLAVPRAETQVVKEEPIDSQLKLVAPTEASVGQNEVVTPSSEQTIGTTTKPSSAAVDSQAAGNKNTKASSELDDAVQSKVAALEKQLAMMQELIVLKDKQLAEIQHPTQTTPVNQTPPNQVSSPDQAKPVPTPATAVKPVPTQVAATPAPVNSVAPRHPVVNPPVKHTIQPQPAVPEESDSSYVPILAGIGVTLLSLFGWLWWRKQKILEETDTDSMFANYSSMRNSSSTGGNSDAIRKIGAESSFLTDFKSSDFEAFESFNVDHGDIDPVAEADVYLTYGRYQQAEDLIRQAIKDTPDRDECKLKLLEIFHANSSKEDFENYATELAAAGKKDDRKFWAQVVEWGQDICPGSELFSISVASTAAVFATGSETLAENVLISPSVSPDTAIKLADETVYPEGAATFEVSGDDDRESLYAQEPSSQQPNEPATKATENQIDEPDLDRESYEDKSGGQQDNQAIDFDLESYPASAERTNLGETKFSSSMPIDENPKLHLGDSHESGELEAYDFDFDFERTEDNKPGKTEGKQVLSAWDSEQTIDFNMDKVSQTEDLGDDTLDFNFDLGIPQKTENLRTNQTEGFGVSDLTDMDEMETKLDLAKAYIDMGDTNSAIEIIGQVLEKGAAEQKHSAQMLLDELNLG